MIQLLIYDFDGLIIDTEEPIFQSWQELYREHGCELDFDVWAKIIGAAESAFDPFEGLEEQLGKPVNRASLVGPRRKREIEMILSRPVLPGVQESLQEAHRLGLKTAVASSSPQSWVVGHLERLGLLLAFDCIKTADDVVHAKPSPDLFLAAAACVGVSPRDALVFEDSPNGVLAAHRAGIRCVAIPSSLTRTLDFSLADLRLNSLADLPLEELLARFNSWG